MKKSITRTLLRLCLATAVLMQGTSAFACGCCFESEMPESFTLGLRTYGDPHFPYSDQLQNSQVQGALAVRSTAVRPKNFDGENYPILKMPFTLRPAEMGKAFDMGRWWLDIPSQGVSLRFEPVPHAQYIRSFQIQKGPRTSAAKRATEQEYHGMVTQKDQIDGTWVVVRDDKGLFKPHAKRLPGHVFLTASNQGQCVSEVKSIRIHAQSPSRVDGGRPDIDIQIGGEAKNITTN